MEANDSDDKNHGIMGHIDKFAVEEQPPSFFGCSLTMLVYIFVIAYVAVTAIGWLSVRVDFPRVCALRVLVCAPLTPLVPAPSQAPDLVIVEPTVMLTASSKLAIVCQSACGCAYTLAYTRDVASTADCRKASPTGVIAVRDCLATRAFFFPGQPD